MFQIVLSFWQSLPWVLFGLAHPDALTAVACAVRALQLWSATPDGALHHPVTLEFCMPGSLLNQQLHIFANGSMTLPELPTLLQRVARLRFASVSQHGMSCCTRWPIAIFLSQLHT